MRERLQACRRKGREKSPPSLRPKGNRQKVGVNMDLEGRGESM